MADSTICVLYQTISSINPSKRGAWKNVQRLFGTTKERSA